MNDQELLLKARELLAVEEDREGLRPNGKVIREGAWDHGTSIRAILAALKSAQPVAVGGDDLLRWAVDGWHSEVANRPMQNVHRRALDGVWRQVIRRLGGDPVSLCGPSHDELRAGMTNAEYGTTDYDAAIPLLEGGKGGEGGAG